MGRMACTDPQCLYRGELYFLPSREKQEIYLKHQYLISELYGAPSKVTNFGEIKSQQDRYVFVTPEAGKLRDLLEKLLATSEYT